MTIPVPQNDPPYFAYYIEYFDGYCLVEFITRERILRTYKPSQHALSEDDVINEFVHEFDAVKL